MNNADEQALLSLKEKLETTLPWPSTYRFKFIFKDDLRLMANIESWFSGDVQVSHSFSRNKTYISLTIDARMRNADEVIDIYRKGMTVEGLIML